MNDENTDQEENKVHLVFGKICLRSSNSVRNVSSGHFVKKNVTWGLFKL